MPPTTAPVQPFRFLDLPTELRLMIYGYALTGPRDATLLSPKVLEVRKGLRGQWVSPSEEHPVRNVSILMVSRKVYTESMPIFYDMNHFHHAILPTVYVKDYIRHFLMHLHLMQHVSIDYMLHTSANSVSAVDRVVSTRVQSIVDGCPNLRTFTLHLLTYFENEDMERGLPADSQTASQLSRLAVRLDDRTYCLDWIAIVAHGRSSAFWSLRNGIAPINKWVVRIYHIWPSVSLDARQRRGIEEREDGHTSQKIRMFFLWPNMLRRIAAREEAAKASE